MKELASVCEVGNVFATFGNNIVGNANVTEICTELSTLADTLKNNDNINGFSEVVSRFPQR